MDWLLLTAKKLLFSEEFEEFKDKYFYSSFDFETAINAASYYTHYVNDSEVDFLFSKEKSLKFEDIKDFKNGIVILGTTSFELDFDDEEDGPHEYETWRVCYSLEELEFFKKEENILDTKPIYYFKLEDDCLKEKQEEYKKLCKEAEEHRMRAVHFKGDIIITDPCYIMRAEHHGTVPLTDDDWDACNYGENMEVFGFTDYLTHSTLYGDWSCTTFNSDTKEPIGEFCADAGLVSVFLLDEVLKYNPDFDYHINKSWTTTLIKDFDGDVCFEKIDDDTLIVKGVGNINFETRQTGF